MTVIFSPDSKYIVSGSGDKTIKLWNTENYELIKTIRAK
jgi:WD40 repeat protein